MPDAVNTSHLGHNPETTNAASNKDDAQPMIVVDDVSMVFNMASETMNNLKEYAIAAVRRQLHFKEFRALDHVSLQVNKGDVYGILGTNGSGKSTILKIIAGVMEPTEGSVQINGGIAPLIELGAGFDMELTARENVYLNGALLGYPKKFIDAHFDEIVDFAEIEQFLDMPLKNYSSGMVARIAFAIATVIVPEILIVDEVLSVGDFMFQQKCERRINALIKEHDVTVLIVSHDTDQIERMCNKAIWIEKGHERITGTAQEVCQAYRMLGGHFGSTESESRIFNLLNQPAPENENLVETFAGENRWSTPVKIVESLPNATYSEVIIAPESNSAVCMLANTLSSLDDTPILLTRSDGLPEIVEQKLKQIQPERVIVLNAAEEIKPQVLTDLHRAIPNAEVSLTEATTEEELSCAVMNNAPRGTWSDKVVLTYKEGLGDILCFLPYTYRNRLPLLYAAKNENPTDKLLAAIAGKEILLLGGEDVFPKEIFAQFKQAGASIERFCGTDPFDANTLINNWIAQHDDITNQEFQAFFVPIWNPIDLLSAGPLTKARKSVVLVEDTQNLDSVTRNLDFVAENKSNISKLVFFGDHTRFSELDKELQLKALGL